VIGRLDPTLMGPQIVRNLSPRPSSPCGIRIRLSVLERWIIVTGAIEQFGLGDQLMAKEETMRQVALCFRIVLKTADPDGITSGTGRQIHMTSGKLTLIVVAI